MNTSSTPEPDEDTSMDEVSRLGCVSAGYPVADAEMVVKIPSLPCACTRPDPPSVASVVIAPPFSESPMLMVVARAAVGDSPATDAPSIAVNTAPV